jgi:hypothetical protein
MEVLNQIKITLPSVENDNKKRKRLSGDERVKRK